jgi:hypothetical protein
VLIKRVAVYSQEEKTATTGYLIEVGLNGTLKLRKTSRVTKRGIKTKKGWLKPPLLLLLFCCEKLTRL